MVKKKFYAVACGRSTGVFDSWDECQRNTQGFPNTKFKGFPTKEEALDYLRQHETSETENTPNKRQRTDFSPEASSGLTAEASRLDVSSPSSPQVVGVKTPNQAIQEKFDMAQAKGEIVELLSPDKSTCATDDTQELSTTTITNMKDVKQELDMDDVKMKMDFDAETVTDPPNPVRENTTLTGDRKVRITEVLGAMLDLKIREANSNEKAAGTKSIRRMEGDVPQLGLHKNFFVQGVRVG